MRSASVLALYILLNCAHAQIPFPFVNSPPSAANPFFTLNPVTIFGAPPAATSTAVAASSASSTGASATTGASLEASTQSNSALFTTASFTTATLSTATSSTSSSLSTASNTLPQDGNDSASNNKGSSLSGGAIAGIVIGCIAIVAGLVGALAFFTIKRGRESRNAHPSPKIPPSIYENTSVVENNVGMQGLNEKGALQLNKPLPGPQELDCRTIVVPQTSAGRAELEARAESTIFEAPDDNMVQPGTLK